MDLQRAIEIAIDAHKGTYDKAGNPYILHPLRVMLSLDTEEEMIVGVLHDVIEDCPPWSFEALEEEGFSKVAIAALKSVTKSNEDHDYMEFVERSKRNPIGRKVKLADINDNLNTKRLKEVTEKDAKRLTKYLKALEFLKSDMASANELRSRDLLSVWISAEKVSMEPLTEVEHTLVQRSLQEYPLDD